MSRSASSVLEETQNNYEHRFNCGICLCPKLKMVYGSCQHKICVDCVYNQNGMRRPSMDKCPTCQKLGAFPVVRPDIPEDNIEGQRCLGIRGCTNKGCPIEVWEWEMEDHLLTCPNRIDSPKPSSKRRQSSVGYTEYDKSKKMNKRIDHRLRRTRSNVSDLSRLRPRRSQVLVQLS